MTDTTSRWQIYKMEARVTKIIKSKLFNKFQKQNISNVEQAELDLKPFLIIYAYILENQEYE